MSSIAPRAEAEAPGTREHEPGGGSGLVMDTNRLDTAAAIDLLTRMVRLDSRTETPGESELAGMLVERMRALGLDARLQEVSPGRFNAIGVWRGTGEGPSLMFNGHLDTNPVTEGWTVDPWGGLVDEHFVYGLGVSNMKAGCASYLAAVEALISQGVRPKGDVVLTFVVGELQGGVGTVAMLNSGVRADYFVNCEPTDLGALTLHAGAVDFAVELTGVTRHLSKREEAVDAIEAACRLVPRLNAMTFSGAASPDHLSVNRANVGVVRGALSRDFHEWRPPQVADFVRMSGTARYAPSQTPDSVLADITEVLRGVEQEFPGLRATVKRLSEETGRPEFPAFEASPDSPVVRAVNDAYRQVRGEPQPTGALRPCCFFGSDAAHLARQAGMDGVVCGPGGRYNTMPDERVDLPDYLDMIKMHMLTIGTICGTTAAHLD
ncbi:M20/M25/M40 family metallo-hydrolase [Streptomyces sp. NPDC005970]|uniref:M20 family metallopeptidase n=1 Tax=Streptomyces sp. NPDC005970 TaxID=3156723 RepID=UPI0033FCBD66